MIPMTTQPTKLTNMALPTMGCGGLASEVDEMHVGRIFLASMLGTQPVGFPTMCANL